MGIEYIKTGIASHKPNGRVERVIGTIEEELVKLGNLKTEEKISIIVRQYNKTYHTVIRYTPLKALKANYNATIENIKKGKY